MKTAMTQLERREARQAAKVAIHRADQLLDAVEELMEKMPPDFKPRTLSDVDTNAKLVSRGLGDIYSALSRRGASVAGDEPTDRTDRIAERIARRVVSADTSVDWSFDITSFFFPGEGQRDYTRMQLNTAKLILKKVLDWSGGEMIRRLRKNINSNPGLVRDAEEEGLVVRAGR